MHWTYLEILWLFPWKSFGHIWKSFGNPLAYLEIFDPHQNYYQIVFVCQLLWYLLESLTRSAATIVDGLK
jgi:hypothetical protein